MEHTISATQARIRFGELMQEAQKGPVTVERDGKPQVVVISKRAYDELISNVPGSGWRTLLLETHRRVQIELAERDLPTPEEIIQQERETRDERYDDRS